MNRAIAAIAFLSFLVTLPAHAGPSQREQQLFDLVNHEREKAGLNKLEWSDRLAQAALAHSKLLAENRTSTRVRSPENPTMCGARW